MGGHFDECLSVERVLQLLPMKDLYARVVERGLHLTQSSMYDFL